MDIAQYIEKLKETCDVVELRHGMETLRVIRAGDSVYKIRHQNTSNENIEWHNRFFGDVTRYEILGKGMWQGREVLLLKQPFIDLLPNSNRAAVGQFIESLRQKSKVVLSTGTEVWADGWHFDNLGERNVGINASTGTFAVVDCLIRRRSDAEVRGLWKRCRIESNRR